MGLGANEPCTCCRKDIPLICSSLHLNKSKLPCCKTKICKGVINLFKRVSGYQFQRTEEGNCLSCLIGWNVITLGTYTGVTTSNKYST